jgi:hypothetical protein
MSAPGPPGVSALFESSDAVDAAVLRLCEAGIPRDRIQVAVAPAAARRYYGGRARTSSHQAMRFGALGGFVGLLAGSALSLVLLAAPGREEPDALLFVQLLGPNLATVTGAVVGSVVGLFVRRRPSPRLLRRALADSDAIVVLVESSEPETIERAAPLLENAGGRGVFVYQ